MGGLRPQLTWSLLRRPTWPSQVTPLLLVDDVTRADFRECCGGGTRGPRVEMLQVLFVFLGPQCTRTCGQSGGRPVTCQCRHTAPRVNDFGSLSLRLR